MNKLLKLMLIVAVGLGFAYGAAQVYTTFDTPVNSFPTTGWQQIPTEAGLKIEINSETIVIDKEKQTIAIDMHMTSLEPFPSPYVEKFDESYTREEYDCRNGVLHITNAIFLLKSKDITPEDLFKNNKMVIAIASNSFGAFICTATFHSNDAEKSPEPAKEEPAPEPKLTET